MTLKCDEVLPHHLALLSVEAGMQRKGFSPVLTRSFWLKE